MPLLEEVLIHFFKQAVLYHFTYDPAKHLLTQLNIYTQSLHLPVMTILMRESRKGGPTDTTAHACPES